MIGYGDDSEKKTWLGAMVVRYPHIACATMAMAYDNGCVNAEQSEEQLIEKLVAWMRRHGRPGELHTSEYFLAKMSLEQMRTLCCDDEDAGTSVLVWAGCQRGGEMDRTLTRIFEEVLS